MPENTGKHKAQEEHLDKLSLKNESPQLRKIEMEIGKISKKIKLIVADEDISSIDRYVGVSQLKRRIDQLVEEHERISNI
jgi:hypothetical protein